ncbi:MAG TPA: pyridoxal-dependent decarboxylase [Candidatus Binatia bacterium]|nr:pyridoxal-dependent decarboxylase [Candidatus Binatia bacterium]
MLDPKDWTAFRALSHAALDDALDYLEGVRERPAWQPVPSEVRARFAEALPEEPMPLEAVYREFAASILPYATGNIHPRFFGWVHGTGTPTGALAELLAATMNANVGGRDHGAVYVERQIVAWSRELFGFPESASGVLTAGSSSANLIAVLVARTKALGTAVRENGIDLAQGRLTAYTSSAAHGCVRRAFEVAGMGSASLRVLPADARHRLDPAAVARAIEVDRAHALRPFMIIATAGTVDVGAIDPLDELAEVARREALWYHVDGAFGATAILAPSVTAQLKGLERADSLAFDFHKWLHVPYDAGCILVRDAELHRATFGSSAPYLTRMSRGLAGGAPWFTDFTLDLSRGFRALKIWFTMKEHGTRRLGEAIETNVRQARRLGEMVEADDAFELLAPVALNIVCFRYRRAGYGDEELDRLNDELVIRLQESGLAVTSSTTVDGKRAIRANITNHRTRDEDLTFLLDALKRIAGSVDR